MKVKLTELIQDKIKSLPLEVREKLASFFITLERIEESKGLLKLNQKELREFTENNYIVDENQKIYVSRIEGYRLFYAIKEISESEDALILLDLIKR